MPSLKSSSPSVPLDADPIDLHVGARLRQRRTEVGISQEQLGKATGLTFQQIQKYERGINRVSASKLYHLGKILDVVPGFFFEGLAGHLAGSVVREGDGQAPLEGTSPETNIMQRQETQELIYAYYRIGDAKQRKRILELIKDMGKQDS